MRKGDRLFLIDGSGYIFRAYHALPPLTRKRDGLPVGAVLGFCNMLWKLLTDLQKNHQGNLYIAVIFDHGSKTFRNDLYPDYKANRPSPPDDLIPQFALIRQATQAFQLAYIEKDGYEADDIIATYASLAQEQSMEVRIISSDKDLMQLVNDHVSLYDAMKDCLIARQDVIDKWGVPPEKMIDLQALVGDSSDNVPGVPGIGPKTAAQLLNDYGDLENLLKEAHQIKQPKRREAILNQVEQIRLSKQLVTLKKDLDLDVSLEDFLFQPIDGRELIAFLKALDFTTLTRRIAAALDIDADVVEASSLARDTEQTAKEEVELLPVKEGYSPQDLVQERLRQMQNIPFDYQKYTVINNEKQLQKWIEKAKNQGYFAFDTETTSLDFMQAELVGFSMALSPNEAAYVPLTHQGEMGDFFTDNLLEGQIELSRALALIGPILQDETVLKIAQNMKYDWQVMRNYQIEIRGYDDTMLLSYVLDSGLGSHALDALSVRWLGHKSISYQELTDSGKIALRHVPIEKVATYAAEDADVTLRLWLILKPRLVQENLVSVYERLDRPLLAVLAQMERDGVTIDLSQLQHLSKELAEKAAQLETEIYEIVGKRFNIASPKQLGDILFEELRLEGGQKTKTGQWKTSSHVLEDLAAQGHQLASYIVLWRQYMKLKSTYTDSLPDFIDKNTGRVHTHYAMTVTSTARLASSQPNLQNIPIRTEEGRKIRRAFIAQEGYQLLSADYSQIELRLLAKIANVKLLQKAFAEDLDIHTLTAAEVFSLPAEDVPAEMRRRAKAINFGIIYGISAFGLSKQLAISNEEASRYIKAYFEKFPEILDYMEQTKQAAYHQGYVETLFGRRIHFPQMQQAKGSMRGVYERAAINAPLQGSAADIIRRAMIVVPDTFRKNQLNGKMLLQVHDELIFEIPLAEQQQTIAVVRQIMENAAGPSCHFETGLKVDIDCAQNWQEAH